MQAAAGIVPPEVLAPPDPYSRGFDRDDTALVLDGWLRRLTGQEGRCRLVLGRLAHAFLGRHGQHVLGFARLGDYARDRLGLSAREVQTLAWVAQRLAGLPAVRAAFAAGEVSWAQLRLLVGVATPGTEVEWLARARGRTVRALAAVIRATGSLPADEDGAEASDPPVRFRLRCPRRVARRWGVAVELARRMAGAQLSQGQAAEAVAEAIPQEVEHLALGVEDLDAFALDERMRAAVGALQRIDWQTGRLLRLFLDRRLYRPMLFPPAARYLRERLGMSERNAP